MREKPRRHRIARPVAIAALLLTAPARTAFAQQNPYSESEPEASPAPPPRSAFEPPTMLTRAEPAYPTDGDGHRVEVELLLTIDTTGAVATVEALGHIPTVAPPSFDAV